MRAQTALQHESAKRASISSRLTPGGEWMLVKAFFGSACFSVVILEHGGLTLCLRDAEE